MPLFITTTNKDISVNSFKTRGYPICFNKTTDYREIYIVDPSNDTKYIYDGHGTRMTIGAQNNTGGGAARSSSTGNGGTWLTQYETAAQTFAGSRCSYSIEGTGFARVTNTTTTITIDCNLPIGTIIMWGKTTNPIQTTTDSTHNRTSQFPKGWYVCNGSNGTPNLSDKFIKGTTSLTSVGGTGGSHTKTLVTAYLPSHSHTLNNHTHTIDHNHRPSTSGYPSAATTGSALTTHSHTIDHTHESFTSGIQSADHTHSIPAHNHTMTHGHTGSSESAGLHGHTITVKSNTVPHSHGISWITNVHSNESFKYGRHKHIVSDARRGVSDNANDRTMVELPNSNKPQDTDTYLDNWKSGESMKGLIQTSYATRRYTNNKRTSWSYLYTFNISEKNSSTETSSYGDGRHNHDGQVYIQQTDISNTTSYSYTNYSSTLKQGTLITHTNHKHDASSNDAGTHSHTITINNFTGDTSNSAALTSGSNSVNHTHDIDVPLFSGSSGSANLAHTHTMAHTHDIDIPLFSGSSGAALGNTGSIGDGKSFDIQPAYYQVVFIMRIS